MAAQPPLHFVFYFAAPPEKVWEGFVSPESNRTIFGGAEFSADLKPAGMLQWAGPGADGKKAIYVHGEILKVDPPKLLQYTYYLGQSPMNSRVTLELVPESEATQVTITHDLWADNDLAYVPTANGWPRILSRLKTLIETGKTFRPH